MLALEKRAERGELPDRLPISAIAALHPEGDAFASILLSAWAAHLWREHLRQSPKAPIIDDCPPPPDDEPGLPGQIEDDVMLTAFMEHRGLVPDAAVPVKDPCTNRHEGEWDPRNGDYVFIRRDDLRAWLIARGEWPLPAVMPLALWWKDADEPKGKRARQLKCIREVAGRLELDLVPENTAQIGEACIAGYPRLFTPEGFKHAWKALKKADQAPAPLPSKLPTSRAKP